MLVFGVANEINSVSIYFNNISVLVVVQTKIQVLHAFFPKLNT